MNTIKPRVVLIIPARYESSRFPGKPLAKIGGKPMIHRVWDICNKIKDIGGIFVLGVYVATDDDRIKDYCESENIPYIMTSKNCLTGTDRVSEAVDIIDSYEELDYIINVQGDEPLISIDDIKKVIDGYVKVYPGVCCGMCPIDSKEDFESRSFPKVVTDINDRLLYISRAPIPYNKEGSFVKSNRQVCIYVFDRSALGAFGNSNSKTPLEDIEDIEILRFLEMGCHIHMVNVSSSIAVDNPEDIERVECELRKI